MKLVDHKSHAAHLPSNVKYSFICELAGAIGQIRSIQVCNLYIAN